MTRTPTTPEAGAEAVTLDKVYPHPPRRVWEALTDPKTLAKWLLPNDFRPRLGHRFTFRDGRRGRIRCQVTALDEARRLTYTWQRDGESLSVVSWTLEPVGGQATRVRVTHTGPQACAFWTNPMTRLTRVLIPIVWASRRAPDPVRQRSSR